MYTVNNKFEAGEECYTVYRKPIHYKCPICEGNGKFMYNGYEIRCNNCCGTGKLHNHNQTVMDVCKVRVRRLKVSIYENVVTIKYCINPIEPVDIRVNNRSETNLFKTIEEAEKYCVEANTKQVSPEF